MLRQHGPSLGLGEGFSIIDQGDASDLMHFARQTVGAASADEARRRFPRKDTLAAIYSRVVNAGQPLGDVLRRSFPWVQEHEAAIAQIFDTYTRRKRDHHLLDFDDLLLYWRAAAADPIIGAALAASYDHVLVDEYQDTNLIQADIVRSLRQGGRGVTVVGDDAQAIYAFRAATVRNMLDFPAQFTGAAVITLERNYRSTQPILDLANAVLAGAAEGYAKRLWTAERGGARPGLATCPDEGAQADAVADVILEHHEAGVALRQQAVLFRSAHHSDLLEVELRRRAIPFVKYGGLRFLEAAHVRDLLAALRVLDNPRDELAWFRLLQLLDGIGPAGARRAMAALGVVRIRVPTRWPASSARDPPAVTARSRDSRRTAASRASTTAGPTPCRRPPRSTACGQGLDPLAPAPLRQRRGADPRPRRPEPASGAATTAEPGRSRSSPSTLRSRPATWPGRPCSTTTTSSCRTVHSAKGGEWRVVHLIHAADGMFPSDLATGDAEGVEEERRLFYVALTRAREHLHIYAPLRYHHSGPFGRGDTHSYGQRTRFLPPSVDGLLDHRAVRASRVRHRVAGGRRWPCLAVEDALRGLW